MTPRLSPRARQLQPLHAWLLAALLLAAQALGLAHGVAHAPGLPGAAAAHAAAVFSADLHAHGDGAARAHSEGTAGAHAEGAADAHAHGHGAIGAAAGSHHEAGSADCRLIDQLAHADAMCGSAGLPPELLRTAATGAAVDLPSLPAGSAAAYLARGPPASV